MPEALAKGVAVTVAALLTVVIAILIVTGRPPAGADTVTAEFDNAFPLIEGMYVRVDGAIAGTVGEIEVNERGNAEVELVLNDSIEPAAADATAAIRQQDTTGDSYVAFDPGDADEPLGDAGIVCASFETCDRTLVAPRLDDLLNSFGPSERAGIKLILVETAKALDRRGADLNGAALELKPAPEQANVALGQINEQNDALGQLIDSTADVTGQAAKRDEELGRLVGSLAATLDAVETRTADLGAGLDRLPETASRARTTLAALSSAAAAAQPLAENTAAASPLLASAIARFPGFVDNASGFIDDTRSTLLLTKKLLRAAQPTLEIGSRNLVTGLFDLVGANADLLNSVLGGEDAFPALFGDDSYGVGEGTLGKRGFGSVAVEPGDLPGYPASHAPRNWLRVSAVINCEVFGVPVRPGCLTEALSSLRGSGRSSTGGGLNALTEAATGVRGAPGAGGGGDGSADDGGNSGGGNPGNPGSGNPGGAGPPLGGGPGLGLPGLGGKDGPLGALPDIPGLGALGLRAAGDPALEALRQLRKAGEVRPYRDLMKFLIR